MPRKPKGEGQPKPKVRRTSPKADLSLHNGQEIAPAEESKDDSNPTEQESNVQNVSTEVAAPVNNESNTAVLLIEDAPKPIERVFMVKVTVDQIGIRFKSGEHAGELVDPNNNILKSITYESKGNVINIAHAAGRIANELSAYYQNVRGKGINRSVGFNVNLHITDTRNGETSWEQFTVVEKLRMSNEIDVAYAVGDAVLRQVEGENAESLITGDFRITVDGQMFLRKCRMNADTMRMPLGEVRKLVDIRRKQVKSLSMASVKEQKEEMGFIKPKPQPQIAAPVADPQHEAAE